MHFLETYVNRYIHKHYSGIYVYIYVHKQLTYVYHNGLDTLQEILQGKERRVARFFLVQNTKMGKNIPSYHELYQISIKYSKRP
jgi:hypothetical protein